MNKCGIWIMAACLLAFMASPVLASGFSIYEQSAKASAQAGAWVARADDAAAVWYNPAAMVRLDGMQVQFGMNLITVGSDTDLTTSDAEFGLPIEMTFEAEQYNATPIHMYFTQPINDRMSWGISINNPFGLVSEWSDMPITFSHRRAELVTFVVNPNIAFKLGERWSAAVGLDYMFADVKEFSRQIPVDYDTDEGYDVIGVGDMSGDGNDIGWNVALHYAADSWSFGFTYRAELSPDLEGNMDFSGFEETPVAPFFPDSPGGVTLDLPAQAAVGIAWEMGKDWVMEFDISWAEWSSFEALDIDIENEIVPDIYLREDWDDTKAFRLGAARKVADRHELRFGILTDESPVPRDTLRPSIPDSDRDAITLGYGYKGDKWDFDFYYMPLWFDDITAEGEAAEGIIDGTYTSFTHLMGATVNYRF